MTEYGQLGLMAFIPDRGCAEDEMVARDTLAVLKDIRDYLNAMKPQSPNGEQQLLAIVKGVAEELNVAAEALEQSAAQLKADSKGFRAGQAKQAAMRARQAAQDLVRG